MHLKKPITRGSRRSSATFLLASLLVCSPAFADDGRRLFQANGCAACHYPAQDRTGHGLGPSLAQVADAYRGRADALVEFLRGNGEPLLYPDKYRLMKAQLPRVMALSDRDLRSLAQYMLTF